MTVLTVKHSSGGGEGATYDTIKDALSAAVEGDTIKLSPGRYEEVVR